jgi:hypothetical protein
MELVLVVCRVGIRCDRNLLNTVFRESSKNVESSSKASETPEPAVYSIYPSGGVYDGIERCLEGRDSARSSGIGSTRIACRGRFWGRRTSGIADN